MYQVILFEWENESFCHFLEKSNSRANSKKKTLIHYTVKALKARQLFSTGRVLNLYSAVNKCRCLLEGFMLSLQDSLQKCCFEYDTLGPLLSHSPCKTYH